MYLDFLLLTHLTLSAVLTVLTDTTVITLFADFAFIVLIAVIAGTDRQSLNQSPVYADPLAFHSAEPGHLAFRELMYGRSQLSAHFLICQFSCYI